MRWRKAYCYVVYGASPTYLCEAAFSIASLRNSGNRLPVVILTDSPQGLPRVPGLRVLPTSRATIRRWMGQSNYHFRIKVAGLRYLLESHVDNIIYLDTDTLVRCRLDDWFDAIGQQASLLHSYEGPLGRRRFRRQYRKAWQRTINDGSDYSVYIDERLPMYNSGVIGLNRSHIAATDRAMWLMERIDQMVECHTAEQLALGHVLSQTGRVATVGDRNVLHYWRRDRGRFVRAQLARLLQDHSIESVMTSPSIAGRIRSRRTPLVWTGNKVRRLRSSIRPTIGADKRVGSVIGDAGAGSHGRAGLDASRS